MPVAVSYEQALQHRFSYQLHVGETGWVNHHLGVINATTPNQPASEYGKRKDARPRKGDEIYISDDLYPVAFQIEQDPNSEAGAHFHQADQFQVILPCDGKFGQRAIDKPLVQFAAACSAYGPIVAGKQVMKYFTLRNDWEPGGLYIGEHRPDQFRAGRKPRVAVVAVPHDESMPRARHVEHLVPQDATGLAVSYFELPAGESVTGTEPAEGRGQYWLVLSGAFERDGERYGAGSLCFVRPDEPALTLQAGAGGLKLLCMQFPRRP